MRAAGFWRHRCGPRLSLSLLLLVAPVGVRAGGDGDPLPAAVSMSELQRIVRERSPRVAALRSRIETSRAEVVGAGVLPNPRFTYGRYQLVSHRNTMFEGHTQDNLLMEVPVLIAGQREARLEAAERRVDATAAWVDADLASVLRDAAGLFIRLQAGRKRVEILEQAAGDMQYLHNLVAGRQAGGSASSYDVLRIGVETRGVETRMQNARSELAATAGELGAALGLPGWQPEARGELAPLGLSADPQRLWRTAERNNPELEAARRAGTAADAGIEQANREAWPTPTVQLGAAYTNNPYGMTPYAGISVEIPIFDRNQGGVARAEAEKRIILTEQSAIAARTRVEIERATELLARRRQTRARFEQEVLAKLPDLKQMAEASYRLGQGTLLELLDASRSRTDIRLSHVELIQAEAEAELDALKAAGLLPATMARWAPEGPPPLAGLTDPVSITPEGGPERRPEASDD